MSDRTSRCRSSRNPHPAPVIVKTPDHEGCVDQEGKGDRDLADTSPTRLRRRPRPDGRARPRQSFGQVDFRRVKRRNQAERTPATSDGTNEKNRTRPSSTRTRKSGGPRPAEPRPAHPKRSPHHRPAQRAAHSGQKLPKTRIRLAPIARERRAPPASGAAAEKQARDIRAGDQENEHHRAQEHEQRPHGSSGNWRAGSKRGSPRGRRLPSASVDDRWPDGRATCPSPHVPVQRHAGLQTCDRTQIDCVAVAGHVRVLVDGGTWHVAGPTGSQRSGPVSLAN